MYLYRCSCGLLIFAQQFLSKEITAVECPVCRQPFHKSNLPIAQNLNLLLDEFQVRSLKYSDRQITLDQKEPEFSFASHP